MIKRELAKFLVVGTCTVAVDYFTYDGLLSLRAMPVEAAKASGFFIGTLFAYFTNRFWTFGQQSPAPGSAWRFLLLYASTLLTNVLVNSATLSLVAAAPAGIHIAFLIATGVSASLNFIGMKLFVFKSTVTSRPT